VIAWLKSDPVSKICRWLQRTSQEEIHD